MPTSSEEPEPRDPIIQPNGKEYLVTTKGSVFVALSLAQAEAIATRIRAMTSSRHPGSMGFPWSIDSRGS